MIASLNEAGLQAEKIIYNSKDYTNCNHVDIKVSYKGRVLLLIDSKIQTISFRRALDYVNIEPEKCLILDLKAVEHYKLNTIPTFVVIQTKDNFVGKHGFYAMNVKKPKQSEYKYFQKENKSGSCKETIDKYNINSDNFQYYANYQELIDAFVSFVLNKKD